MKTAMHVIILLATLGSGCSFRDRGLVLDPVGPPLLIQHPAAPEGTLVVYSAQDQTLHFNGSDYHTYYTDYKVMSGDGVLLKKVHNDSDSLIGGPVEINLPAGRYRVFAQSNRYGWITVPVVIAMHQTTTVHLEGGGSWPNQKQMEGSNPVRLPDGEIAGWRAPDAPPTDGNRDSAPARAEPCSAEVPRR